jgi:UDP-2-acetamido-2,6-beta-L-arabino-hexul-4-ose reductase
MVLEYLYLEKIKMKILITGADGFLGKNLVIHLKELNKYEIIKFTKKNNIKDLENFIFEADVVFHLAGVNRSDNPGEFSRVNVELTRFICDVIRRANKKITLIYSSSKQALQDSVYGMTKLEGEKIVEELCINKNVNVYIYRLPGIFGKWSKPNYNSVVATFCHNKANGIPIYISEPERMVDLIYVDDLMRQFLENISNIKLGFHRKKLKNIYRITLKELASKINSFADEDKTLFVQNVGAGIDRALYSTYLSFLSVDNFRYPLLTKDDPRGIFVEIIKTLDSGQVNFFTAHPGMTRGGHYHHSKNEKFLVVKGRALFKFRNLINNKVYSFEVSDEKYEVIRTVPGWVHDITNIGQSDMLVILWSNEVFDFQNPDTFAESLQK